jgi:hypothetical protein
MKRYLVNPVIQSKKVILSAKVEYTSCPITTLILQNKPNFPHFSLKIEDFVQKQSQNKPNSNPKQTKSNPIYIGESRFIGRRRIIGFVFG